MRATGGCNRRRTGDPARRRATCGGARTPNGSHMRSNLARRLSSAEPMARRGPAAGGLPAHRD